MKLLVYDGAIGIAVDLDVPDTPTLHALWSGAICDVLLRLRSAENRAWRVRDDELCESMRAAVAPSKRLRRLLVSMDGGAP